MYCPKCGHRQTSDEMRFCSRCGFQLAGVSELLANDGIVPALPERSLACIRPRVSRRGVRLIFFSVILFPIFLALSFFFDSPTPLFLPAILFMSGLTQVAYKGLFGEDLLSEYSRKGLKKTRETEAYLPPAADIPAQSFFKRETNDLVAPPSITERTTTLLEK